jgi:small subunit ribosomal protein S4
MRIGPKYKIARRYGPELFEKTSTQKFALREAQRAGKKIVSRSDYAHQLAAKQKARFFYGIGNASMRAQARTALQNKNSAIETLYGFFERRLDNVAYRAGLAVTRRAARQLVSHGHLVVNGKKITIPSYLVSKGDEITIRRGSITKKVWPKKEDATSSLPQWIFYDENTRTVKIIGEPKLKKEEMPFSIDSILQFYRR